jgi:hypothetical protein
MAIEYINKRKVYIALADDGYPENPDVGSIVYFVDSQEKYIYASGEWRAYTGFVL